MAQVALRLTTFLLMFALVLTRK